MFFVLLLKLFSFASPEIFFLPFSCTTCCVMADVTIFHSFNLSLKSQTIVSLSFNADIKQLIFILTLRHPTWSCLMLTASKVSEAGKWYMLVRFISSGSKSDGIAVKNSIPRAADLKLHKTWYSVFPLCHKKILSHFLRNSWSKRVENV